MWSSDGVRAAALDALPGDRADRVVSTVQQGWRLVDSDDPDDVVVRVGGPARLAAGETWPVNARGIAMTFLAELDLARRPAHPAPWAAAPARPPSPAILRVFGNLVDNPYEPGSGLILPLPDGPNDLVEAPPLPDPWPTGGAYDDLDVEERVHVLPASDAAAEPILTIPEHDPGQPPAFARAWTELDYREHMAWYELAWSLRFQGRTSEDVLSGRSHVFGAPISIQDDPRYSAIHEHPEVADPHDWTVLLALHLDLVEVLDGGAYHVLVPTSDLQAGRWDRVVIDVSSC